MKMKRDPPGKKGSREERFLYHFAIIDNKVFKPKGMEFPRGIFKWKPE